MRVHDSLDTCLLEVREQAANDVCVIRPTKNPRKMAPSGSFFEQVLLSIKYDLLLVKHQSHPVDIAGFPFSLHTCKAYDPSRKFPSWQIEQLRTMLSDSLSSINSQPWHYVMAASDKGKTHIAKAIQHPVYAADGSKIHNGSHVFVFCARTTMDYRTGENCNVNLPKYHLPVGAVIFNL
ncbi:MAG: nitroreductase family protein [Burkholderiales bacterium]